MFSLRPSNERGVADRGWLRAKHSFSFGGYFDPQHMKFASLRVINEDRIEGGMGFGTHPHENMEILTYVISGALEHKDSLGHAAQILPGELQRMSAGTGIRHSEYNAHPDEELHLLQIWIEPETQGIEPGYEQKFFGEERRNALRLVASPNGEEGSLTIHQQAWVHASLLDAGKTLGLERRSDAAWVQVVSGKLRITGGSEETSLQSGDGLAVSGRETLELVAEEDANFLIFEL